MGGGGGAGLVGLPYLGRKYGDAVGRLRCYGRCERVKNFPAR